MAKRVKRVTCPSCQNKAHPTRMVHCDMCGRDVCDGCYSYDHGACGECIEEALSLLGRQRLGLGRKST